MLICCPVLNQSISSARARTQALLSSTTLYDVRLRMSLERFSSPCPQLSARPKISFVATRARLRNPLKGKRTSCSEFARAASFAAPCGTRSGVRTFSESFQWYCQRCVAIYFCDSALVPLVCIARICGRARWLSFPMNTALPAPYSTRDTIRFCEHRHDTSGVVLSTSGVLKELLSSVHLDMLHGPHMCMYMSTCGVVP